MSTPVNKMPIKEKNPLKQQVGGNHYIDANLIGPMEFCELHKCTAMQSAAIKYAFRHGKKGGREGGKRDLLKAKHCIDMLLETYYSDVVLPEETEK